MSTEEIYKYIEKFRVYAGRDVLITLLYDKDTEVKQAARDALDRLKWSDKMPEKESETTTAVTTTTVDDTVTKTTETETPTPATVPSQPQQPQVTSQPQSSQPVPTMQRGQTETETRVQQSRPNREIEAPKRRPIRNKKD